MAEITFSFKCATMGGTLAMLNAVDDPNCEVLAIYIVLGREVLIVEYGYEDIELSLSPEWELTHFGSNQELIWKDEPITDEKIAEIIDIANLPKCLPDWSKMWSQVLEIRQECFV